MSTGNIGMVEHTSEALNSALLQTISDPFGMPRVTAKRSADVVNNLFFSNPDAVIETGLLLDEKKLGKEIGINMGIVMLVGLIAFILVKG